MRDYVEALGGHLRLVAEFPGVGPVEIIPDDMRSPASQGYSHSANAGEAQQPLMADR
jgi:hypothetical protein